MRWRIIKKILNSSQQRLAEEEKQKPQTERSELGLMEKLEFVVNNDFERLTYTEALTILKESNHNKKKKFQYPDRRLGNGSAERT